MTFQLNFLVFQVGLYIPQQFPVTKRYFYYCALVKACFLKINEYFPKIDRIYILFMHGNHFKVQYRTGMRRLHISNIMCHESFSFHDKIQLFLLLLAHLSIFSTVLKRKPSDFSFEVNVNYGSCHCDYKRFRQWSVYVMV